MRPLVEDAFDRFDVARLDDADRYGLLPFFDAWSLRHQLEEARLDRLLILLASSMPAAHFDDPTLIARSSTLVPSDAWLDAALFDDVL
jgi:hypothetical protein